MKPAIQSDYPLHQLIGDRWSPRAFADTPVTQETALTLLEAARWAASANNEQPWRFAYATRDQADAFRRIFDCLVDRNRTWAVAVPLLVMTFVATRFTKTGEQNPWVRHDLGLAVGNLTMQASTMKLYVHSMAGFSIDKAREAFALPPEIEPVTVIAVGYLGDPAQLPEPLATREGAAQERKTLAELLL
jgi:nitroreductase